MKTTVNKFKYAKVETSPLKKMNTGRMLYDLQKLKHRVARV